MDIPARSQPIGDSKSSVSSLPNDQSNTIKRSKPDRACDACRRRKTKCDGSKTRENSCTNCLHARKPCTYVEESRPRGPSKAYVTGLEDRMERLEALLAQLRPAQDFSMELGPDVVRGSWRKSDVTQSLVEKQSLVSFSSSELKQGERQVDSVTLDSFADQQAMLSGPDSMLALECFNTSEKQHLLEDTDGYESSEESTNFDIIEIESISGLVQKLTLHEEESIPVDPSSGAHVRFHGKSSSVGLVGATQRFKMMTLLESMENSQGNLHDSPEGMNDSTTGFSSRRQEYWTMPQRERDWEEVFIDTSRLIEFVLTKFPPPDLATELINLYFHHVNPQFPLLHRTTFHRQWEEKLYEVNIWFIAVCLGVFALASRWLKAPRLAPGSSDTNTPAGWIYCETGIKLHATRRHLFYPATLFEIQSFALFGIYTRGTPYYALAWTLVGVGIRKAQDVGAHRKKVYRSKPTVNQELWKRAFWCLVVLDRFECVSLGRSCIIGEEDFDVDLPLEVDDEYWMLENSATNFQQPDETPAKISAFNQLIRLSQVMAYATKTLYTIDKSKNLFGHTSSSWRHEIFTRLDSTLQEWYASLPAHLSWSKIETGSLYIIDAATLQIAYHLIQMLIFQHFIRTPFSRTSSMEPFPYQTHLSVLHDNALDICVNAAQACARICDHSRLMRQLLTWPMHIFAAELSCTTLLIKIWDIMLREREMHASGAEDIKPPSAQVVEPLMADVKVYIRMLEAVGPQWGFITSLQELQQYVPGGPSIFAARLDGYHREDHTSLPPVRSQSQRLLFTSRPLQPSWGHSTAVPPHNMVRKRTLTSIPNSNSFTKQGSSAQSSYLYNSDLYAFDDGISLPFGQMKSTYRSEHLATSTMDLHTNTTQSFIPFVNREIRPEAAYISPQSSSRSTSETLSRQRNDQAFSSSTELSASSDHEHVSGSASLRRH